MAHFTKHLQVLKISKLINLGKNLWNVNFRECIYFIWFRFKNRKAELKQRIRLACFLMVPGELPLSKITSNSKTNPNPKWERGDFPDTFPYDCGYNIRFAFTKHTAHSGEGRLTHPYKYIFTPPVMCLQQLPLLHQIIKWTILWYQNLLFTMPFLFKNYSLVSHAIRLDFFYQILIILIEIL